MSGSEVPAADAAWVVIDAPLSPAALARFCGDLERLYRINPYYEFRTWRPLQQGRFHAELRNLSINKDWERVLSLEHESDFDFTVRYDRGIKHATRFQIAPGPMGSRLTVTDDYGPAAADEAAVDTTEVDRSLHAWGVALHDYLRRQARWGRYAPWRWYMRRVWVPMKPAARRITFIILMVTLAEIALIALVMAIYLIETGT
jgi:hypothetical protein